MFLTDFFLAVPLALYSSCFVETGRCYSDVYLYEISRCSCMPKLMDTHVTAAEDSFYAVQLTITTWIGMLYVN